MNEDFAFSDDGLNPEAAFAEYARLYANGADVLRGEGPFRARVRGWRFDGFLVFDRRLSGMIQVREDRVAEDGFDHIVAHLVVSGALIGSKRNGFASAGPGEIVFVDTRRGNRTEPRDAHLITVSIARDLIEAAVGNANGLHGRVLQPPASLMLADYLQSLVRHAAQLDATTTFAYARALVDLLSAALIGQRELGADIRRQDFLRREAVERVIAAEIGNRKLTSGMISDITGISRSTLYRLFEGAGGVARLVTLRRADAVRARLEDGGDETLAVLAARYGFADERQLKRAFETSFATSPEIYRANVRALPTGDSRTGHRRWRGWMQELS